MRSALNAGLWATVLLLWAGEPANSTIRLPQILSDGVVLQRDKPIRLWGWAQAGEGVSAEFRGARSTTRANRRGEWTLNLPAFGVGPAADLRIVGDRAVVIKDVLVGDVWIASGQSNMQFPIESQNGFGGIDDAADVARNAHFPEIHLFQVTRETATAPRSDLTSTGWHGARPETVGNFSAVAYLFGQELHQRYGVPIGVIEATWGGTPIQTWMSAASLRGVADFAGPLAREARLTKADDVAYARYRAAMTKWYGEHGSEDRGRLDGNPLWAAADVDDRHWLIATEPRPWPDVAVPGFDGTMWLRKIVKLDAADLQGAAVLHLCALLPSDTTFVNGHQVGATSGEIPERAYAVPASLLRMGSNSVAIRIAGTDQTGMGFVGMHGDARDLFFATTRRTIPLAGRWRVETGPDLARFPRAAALAEFRSPFPQAPSLLYNSMIAPLHPLAIKGFLWYQGESDVGVAARYRALFPRLISSWRVSWNDVLPFLFVQIAGFGRDGELPGDSRRAELRDAQTSGLRLPTVAMATAFDLGERDNIHPTDKRSVAHRLALAAERIAYGEPVTASGPQFDCQRIDGDAIRLRFVRAEGDGGLVLENPAAHGFAIAGREGHYLWADARLDGSDVVVRNPRLSHPLTVRYGWRNTPAGVLRDSAGLPSPPFETTARDCEGRTIG